MKLSTTSLRQFAVNGGGRFARVLLAAITLHAGGAFAADCDIRLSNSDVDYGALTGSEVRAKKSSVPVSIGKKQVALTVVCREARTFALQFDAPAASADAYRFGKSGYFTLNLKQAAVDGQPALIEQSARPDTVVAGASDNARLLPERSVAIVRGNSRVTGKTLMLQVEVETFVDDATARVRDRTPLDGRGVLRLVP